MNGQGVFAWSTARNEADAFVRFCKNFLRVGIMFNLMFIASLLAGWIQPA